MTLIDITLLLLIIALAVQLRSAHKRIDAIWQRLNTTQVATNLDVKPDASLVLHVTRAGERP